MAIKRNFILMAGIAVALLGSEISYAAERVAKEQQCDCCHMETAPTTEKAALRKCPRTREEAETKDNLEPPDVILLDQLVDLYAPVVFVHKRHAGMSHMGAGCEICHHQNEDGKIGPCSQCHGGPSNPVNLRQPGLKGAYHRQCLSCHREWSHDTDCVICHAKLDPNKPVPTIDTDHDIMGLPHPKIHVPDLKIYEVDDDGDESIVSFHHKDHVERFSMKCVDCHQEESCQRCHEIGEHEPLVREDPHEDCISCHQKDIDDINCEICHKEQVVEHYSHKERTGFALNGFHQQLECKSCHQDLGAFSALKKECTDCHGEEWPPETVDHTKLGVVFAEDHDALECGDCHAEGFNAPRTCAACHDDERSTFPTPEEKAAEETDADPDAE